MSPSEGRRITATYQNFKNDFEGFLMIWLKSRWPHDHLEPFIDDGAEYSIIHGYWADPRASGILQSHEDYCIRCIMMDTIWLVIREYVAAILAAVSPNTAIPLTFAFGRVRYRKVYEMFWSVFSSEFEVDLSSFILMSDQGTCLRKFPRQYDFTHRFCLRHFLASLQDRVCFVFVHHAVITQTEQELEMLLDVFGETLDAAIIRAEGNGLRKAQSEFGKASLLIHYSKDETFLFIEIGDAGRWAQALRSSKVGKAYP
jgi:hypothetical protein